MRAELEKPTSSDGNMAKDKLRHIVSLRAICEHGRLPVWGVPWAQAGSCWLGPTYVMLEGDVGRVGVSQGLGE